jgi:hypothetical protein
MQTMESDSFFPPNQPKMGISRSLSIDVAVGGSCWMIAEKVGHKKTAPK